MFNMESNAEICNFVPIKQEGNESETKCFEEFWDPNNDEQPSISATDNLKCGEVLLICQSSYILVCSLCSEQFYNLELFGNHFNTSHSDCIDMQSSKRMKLESETTLFEASETHLNTAEYSQIAASAINSGENGFKCWCCSQRFDSTESLSTHLVEHQGNNNCSQSNKQFADRPSHSANHSSGQKTKSKFVCEICGREINNRHNYNQHIRTHERHFNNTLKKVTKVVSHERLQDANQVTSYKNTPEIGISSNFNTPGMNMAMNRLKPNENRSGCGANESMVHQNSHLPLTQQVERKAKFVCETCGKDFNYRFNYTRHLKIHDRHLTQMLKNVIKEVSDRGQQDSKPETEVENNPETEVATRCSTSEMEPTTNQIKIEEDDENYSHTSLDSSPQETFKCEHCHREMNNRFAFTRHVESHLVRKFHLTKYSCRLCEQRFIHKSSCNRHEKRHLEVALPLYAQITMQESSPLRKNIIEMSSACDIGEASAETMSQSDQTTPRNFDLMSPEQQKEMMEFFVKRPNLIKEIPPNGNGKFRCDECGKYLPTNSSLQRHYGIHRIRKLQLHRFTCEICDRGFLTNYNYKRHLQRHEKWKQLKASYTENDVGVNNSS